MEDTLHSIFGVLGNVFAAALFLSPVKTMYEVVKRGSVEEFSGAPYVATLVNCLLYTWYSSPIVTSNNILLMISNATGGVLQIFYIAIYIAYSPPQKKSQMIWLLLGVAAMFGVILGFSLFALSGSSRTLFVGIAGATFSICMYASPLFIMRLVIVTKSVEYMPFLLSLSVFLCSGSWFIYAVFGDDLFVKIPNGVGVLLGAAQLILYCIYCNGTSRKAGEVAEKLLENA